MYDGGWDNRREARLQSLKDLGIIDANAPAFPRLANVKAWDNLPAEQQAEFARDMEVYAAMVDYLDEQINRLFDALKSLR